MTKEEMDRGFQEIWKLYRETDKRFMETDRRFMETDRRFMETDRRFMETDRRFMETDRRFKETDRMFKETSNELRELNKELDKKIENVSKTVERTSLSVDKLTGKWSKFVEGLIAPAAIRLFKKRGIEVDSISQRVKRIKEGGGIEIDILALDGDYAVLIEAKSTLKVDDVNDHIERLKKFKYFFPEYADKKVIGAVGGIVIDEYSDKYANKQGMFVIAQSGDTVMILNDESFKPKLW